MTAGHRDEEAIFNAAKQLPSPLAVRAYLEEACAGDAALRARLEQLLNLTDEAKQFFEEQSACRKDLEDTRWEAGGAAPGESGLPALDDYELLEELGRGGVGVVYKARQRSLDRLVAIKFLLSGPLARPDYVQRFRVEASAAASLRHPNIVAVHEVGVKEGYHYLVMDYIAGQTLAGLSGGQPFSPRTAAGIIKTIAEAVHFAHEHKVLHRDLKPSNVLVDHDEQPHVTDFGLAKRLDAETDLTLSGQILGSPSYMSPEQANARRGQVGRHSDVYSLGALLFCLLTGRPPFVAETISDTIQLVLEGEPITPRTLVLGIPRDLETICLKCLRKEPAKRYETARELAAELDRYLNGEPILARRAGQFEKFWRWCRRRPALASLGAVTLLSLLAVVVGSPIAIYRISKARQSEMLARSAAVQSELAAKYNSYVANINLAGHALEEANFERLQELLDETAEEPNHGFEWYYLQQQAHRAIKTLNAGAGVIHAVAVSADGSRIASGNEDGTAIVWEVKTGMPSALCRGHTAAVKSVAFSPGGKRLLTGSMDGTAVVWDANSGKCLFSIQSDSATPIESAVFSPDGHLIALGFGEADTGPMEATGSVRLYDAETGDEMTRFAGHAAEVFRVAFSPSGRQIVTASADRTAIVWETSSGRPLVTLKGHEGRVRSAAFSPDGERIVTASEDKTAKVWNVSDARNTLTLQGDNDVVWSAAFSPDGRRIATVRRFNAPDLGRDHWPRVASGSRPQYPCEDGCVFTRQRTNSSRQR